MARVRSSRGVHRTALPGPDQPERCRRRGRHRRGCANARRAARRGGGGVRVAALRRLARRRLPASIARGGGGQLPGRRQRTSTRRCATCSRSSQPARRRSTWCCPGARCRAATSAAADGPAARGAPGLRGTEAEGDPRNRRTAGRGADRPAPRVLALDAGADMLKTSTGKTPHGAPLRPRPRRCCAPSSPTPRRATVRG